ncbi:MAG: hypothetical protein QOJ67_3820 [Acidimicrobiaceae bacterium]|jgi:glycosyltransferase involved in cell wall biosynthesis
MESRLRVTVTIPTYNRAHLLPRSITSVLEQSFGEFEIFVSDNCSTDDTEEVVRAIDDSRVHYVRNATNLGVHANLSRGFELGDASLVTVLPDDDVMLPGNLERKVRVLEEDPTLGLAHSASRLVHLAADGSVIASQTYETGGDDDHVLPAAIVLARLLSGSYWINFPAALVRRSVIQDVRFQASDGLADDFVVALRLVRNSGSVAYIAEPLVALHQHGGQLSTQQGYQHQYKGAFHAGIPAIAHLKEARDRFLAAHDAELGDQVETIRANAKTWTRQQLLDILERDSDNGRDVAVARRRLREATALDPTIALTPQALGLLAKSVTGQRGRQALGRLRRRLVTAARRTR